MASLPAIGAMQDPLKWNLPGWRIEQRFDNKVLIGNWYEERKQVSQSGMNSRWIIVISVLHLLKIRIIVMSLTECLYSL